jgi:hypothetical protein
LIERHETETGQPTRESSGGVFVKTATLHSFSNGFVYFITLVD